MKFSGLREDTEWLYVLTKALGGKHVYQQYATTPLLVIPKDPEFRKEMDGRVFSSVEDISVAMDQFPDKFTAVDLVDRAVYMHLTRVPVDAREELSRAYGVNRTTIYIGSVFSWFRKDLLLSGLDRDDEAALARLKSFGDDVNVISAGFVMVNYDFDTGDIGPAAVPWFLYNVTTKKKVSLTTDDPAAMANSKEAEALSKLTAAWLHDLSFFSEWAYTRDLYPVIKRSSTPDPRDKQQTYRRTDLPRLVYLNKLPTPSSGGHQGGTHASPCLHQRRGHYKTLKHPKFQNHPKYGVENGVYVRPAWVGDRETVHEGNRYTVIVPSKS